jgi:putative SOS response-associated peptidase YedK
LANGFYEWKALVEAKKPYLIQRHDHKPFAFAGIWDKVKMKTGEIVDACTILTTKPKGVLTEVHDRMPVILPRDALEKWLDPTSRYLDLLEPDADALELVPVSALVNNVKNDDARLVERV